MVCPKSCTLKILKAGFIESTKELYKEIFLRNWESSTRKWMHFQIVLEKWTHFLEFDWLQPPLRLYFELMKKILKYLEDSFRSSLRFSGLLTLTFFLSSTILFFMRKFSQTSLLFDQIMVALVLCLIILIGFSKARVLVNRTINIMIKDIVICVLLTFLLLTSTLLNVDRSRSLYILSWVENGKIKVVNNEYDFSRIQSKEVLDGEGIKLRSLN